MKYFGQWWDAPAYDDGTVVPTPVGVRCHLCSEEIGLKDSGNYGIANGPVHLECWLRALMGSREHLEGHCTCTGVGDEPQGTFREQGRQVMEWVKQQKGLVT